MFQCSRGLSLIPFSQCPSYRVPSVLRSAPEDFTEISKHFNEIDVFFAFLQYMSQTEPFLKSEAENRRLFNWLYFVVELAELITMSTSRFHTV